MNLLFLGAGWLLFLIFIPCSIESVQRGADDRSIGQIIKLAVVSTICLIVGIYLSGK